MTAVVRCLIHRSARKTAGPYAVVAAWIDTAFDGHLVFPSELIGQLELESLAKTEAVLTDGTLASFDTYLCYVESFGDRLAVQVMANNGRYPLLGTGLLEHRDFHINYQTGEITID